MVFTVPICRGNYQRGTIAVRRSSKYFQSRERLKLSGQSCHSLKIFGVFLLNFLRFSGCFSHFIRDLKGAVSWQYSFVNFV